MKIMHKLLTVWIKLIVISAIIFCSKVTIAQSIDIGLGLGGIVYWGDLNTESLGTNLSNTNLAVQVNANYVMSDYISLRGGLLYGPLSGDDSKSSRDWQRRRNLSFSSILIEGSFLGELHFFGYNKLGEDSPFSPFLVGGLTGAYFSPKAVLDGQSYDLQSLGTEGQGMAGFDAKYSKLTAAIAFGAGIKFKLSESVTIVADGIARRAFTDYLDDVSGAYVSYPELAAGNGELAARLGNRQGEFLGQSEPVIIPTGSKRGGQFVSDYYISAMVTFYIRLSEGYGGFGNYKVNTSKCPKF